MSKTKGLISAIVSRDVSDMMMLLKDMTADEVNAKFDDTGAGLHFACLVNNTTAVSVLLNLNNIEVNSTFTMVERMWNVSSWFGVDLRNSYFTGYTPIMIAAARKYKESFGLLVQDEKVDLKAAVSRKGKVFGIPEILKDSNVENHDMLVKLLAAIRRQPNIEAPNIEIPRTTELDVFKERQNNFRKLLESGEMSDFRVICRGEIFPCHKNILCSQSNVLRNMFNNEMKESKEDCMSIDDLEPTIVKLLINFIYTGDIGVDETKKKSIKLIEVADRYELKGLAKVCETQLIPTIDNNNVLEMVVNADLYHADHLREVAMKWIVANKLEIVKQEGWKAVLAKFPYLMLDLF